MEDNSRFLVKTTAKKLFAPTLFLRGHGIHESYLKFAFAGVFFRQRSHGSSLFLFPHLYYVERVRLRHRYRRQHFCFLSIRAPGTGRANRVFHKALWMIVVVGLIFAALPFLNLQGYATLLGATRKFYPGGDSGPGGFRSYGPQHAIFCLLLFRP